MSLASNLRYAPIVPGGMVYRAVFAIGRAAVRLGLLKPDTRVEYLEGDGWMLVLTPLAGSSSIRAGASGIRRLDVAVRHDIAGRRLLVMDRAYAARMRSFYNKKVRNPTSIAKALLLATCPPLTHRSTPLEFVDYVHGAVGLAGKDKHLYTVNQICASCGRRPDEVQRLEIGRDRAMLESLLGLDLGRVVNSSESVATHAAAVELPAGAFDCLQGV